MKAPGLLLGLILRGAASDAVVSVDQPATGALGPGDERAASGAFVDTWRLEGTAATLTVLVESEDVDTRVSLRDEAGRELASDDQGGIGDNPRLAVKAAAGHSYEVRVEAALAGEAGAYTLKVLAGDAPPLPAKDKAEADLAYYQRAQARARAGGALQRRRLGWVLYRTSALRAGQGLASAGDNLATAEEAVAIAREVKDRRLEGAALRQYGTVHDDAGRPAEAIALLEQARAIDRELGEVQGEIMASSKLSLSATHLGDYRRAIAYGEQALALCEKAGERRLLSGVLNNLAAGYYYLDQHDRAVEYAERSLQLARELEDLPQQGTLLRNLALEYMRLGDYQRAIEYLEESLALARRIGNRRVEALTLGPVAQAYAEVGRSEKAIQVAEQAREILHQLGEPRPETEVLTQLAELHSNLGRHARAVEYHQEALRIQRELGDRYEECETLGHLGDAYGRAGQWERAFEAQEQALRTATETNNRHAVARAQAGLAAVHLRLGRPGPAAAMAEQAIATLRELGFPDLESSAHATLAAAAAASGRPDRAREEFEAAVALIEAVRTKAGVDTDRAGYLDRASALFESYVAFLIQQGQAEAALAVAERARARAFLDLLEGRARSIAGSREGTPVAAPPPSLEQIKQEARVRDATIVEYFIAAERLFIWVVQPDGAIHAAQSDIDRAGLTALVTQMRSTLGMDVAAREWDADDGGKGTPGPAPDPPGSQAPLRRLHQVAVAPIEAWLPSRPERLVTIVPHGPLFLVSFAALPDAAGRYLVERHTLNYTPSIGVLHYTRAPRPGPAAAGQHRLLAVGNPVMPALPGRPQPPIPLPGAAAEARAISRLYRPSRVTTLIGAHADERSIRELAPAYRIIHLATHGFIRDDEPLESLLLLSPSAGPAGASTRADGLLTVREVFELNLDAELVVLSACNTGLGRINGDGVMGLARAFLYAGSPSVLASLWRVPDAVASPEHMARFYRALEHGGHGPAAALRVAQLATIRALAQGRYRTLSGTSLPALPTYWASFVLIGEPAPAR
jgi:CHAT domain-containing protein/tetratricopeptide (TPR) repeat protein